MDSPIRQWLEQVDMTQAAFAEKVGVQTATVNGWCNNKNTNMNASNVLKAAKVMGLSKAKTMDLLEWAGHAALQDEGWFEREAG